MLFVTHDNCRYSWPREEAVHAFLELPNDSKPTIWPLWCRIWTTMIPCLPWVLLYTFCEVIWPKNIAVFGISSSHGTGRPFVLRPLNATALLLQARLQEQPHLSIGLVFIWCCLEIVYIVLNFCCVVRPADGGLYYVSSNSIEAQ